MSEMSLAKRSRTLSRNDPTNRGGSLPFHKRPWWTMTASAPRSMARVNNARDDDTAVTTRCTSLEPSTCSPLGQ